MEKVLGQEYNEKDRVAFLRDNCNAVEEMDYNKPMSIGEIEELRDRMVESNIQLRDVKADKKEAVKEYNQQIRQLEDSIDEVTQKLKAKSRYVTEKCFKFIDTDKCEVGYYNSDGVLVYKRPARPDEMQMSMFPPFMKTGTDSR